MSDQIVIRVENLSKKYVIGHQRESHYMALRDVITDKVRQFGQRILHPLHSADDQASSMREEFWALRDVSFEVKPGERLGIIGRNGAGKSTLLKILSRITEPTRGEVRLRGRVASLLEVGTGFHPELTGRENIYLNGAILGMSRAEIRRKFDEIVAFAEVEKFLDTPVKRYSSGMYVRLAFAVAAHLEPEILLVDEVLAVGDAAFQNKCLGKMTEVAQNGRTVLFVSHNIQAIRRICTKAIYLEGGNTVGIVGVENAIQQYLGQIQALDNLSVNLASHTRKDGNGTSARILSLKVGNRSKFAYGEPCELVFAILCHQPISNLNIGIGFDTLDGYRIMTLDSEPNSLPAVVPPGTHEIRFLIDRNPLHPTQYNVSVAAHSGNKTLDFVAEAARWVVKSGPNDTLGDRHFAGCRIPFTVNFVEQTHRPHEFQN